MEDALLTHQTAIRLAAYGGILVGMAVWETIAPARSRVLARWTRWPSNLGVAALNAGMMRALAAVAPLAAAAWAATAGVGLFNAFAVPFWLAAPLAVVFLDLAVYGQHVAFHKVPALWRLHRMHHADPDLDVTTGARFHPVEIALSAFYKSGLVLGLGAPAAAVVAFEVLLNGSAMFNHGNVRLPPRLDRAVRLAIVTPDMHRVHHSIRREETDSNYGFNLTWWDRLFGTYREAPRDGHAGMTIGLARFRADADQRLDRLLAQPLAGPARDAPGGTPEPNGR
jgi:sterol desaturase/sphingolipid hydroxylase (fatty acid hydroxylase superfamily)